MTADVPTFTNPTGVPVSFSHTPTVDELTLDKIHPNLASQFKALMGEIAAAFQDESEHLNRDTRKATINLKIELKHKLETSATSITASMSAKLPGMRQITNVVRLPHGGSRFLVEVDTAEQMDLYRPKADDGGVQ